MSERPAGPVRAENGVAAEADVPPERGAIRRDFMVRVPARLLKDSDLSSMARLLWVTLAAFADGSTRRTYVSDTRLLALLKRKRRIRERAQNELVEKGWLQIEYERGRGGRWGRRIFALLDPSIADGTFHRSGADGRPSKSQLISDQTTLYQGVKSRSSLTRPVGPKPTNGDEELLYFLLDRAKTVCPAATARNTVWAMARILNRSKTEPTNRRAYLHKAVLKFFRDFSAEVGQWLAAEAKKRLESAPQAPMGDLVEGLKLLAATHELPYDAEAIGVAVVQAEGRLERDRELRSEQTVGHRRDN